MKRLAAILLLSACSQEPAGMGDEADGAAPPAAAAAGNLSTDPASLQARVDQAMGAVLQDPDGANYRNVRAGLAGTICGEVDPRRTRGGHAGFRPFLVTPEGVARVAASPRLSFDDPTDTFPDFYIRWCATAEELKRLEPELRRAIDRSAAAEASGQALPEGPPLDIPADAGGQPAAPPPPGTSGRAEVAPPDVDSFIKSVKRKDDQPPGQ